MPRPYPAEVYSAVGAYIEDSVLMCGGKLSADEYTNECFR